MKFLSRKESEHGRATVIPVTAPFHLERHPSFRAASEADRAYLKGAVTVFDANASSPHTFILPSGKIIVALPAKERKSFTRRKAMLAIRRAITFARSERLTDLEIYLDDFAVSRSTPGDTTEMIALHASLANFEFVVYKEPPKSGWSWVMSIALIGTLSPSILAALERGTIIGEETNAARTLANTPGGDMTPARLALAAEEAGKRTGFAATILDETEMERLGMGAVLGVGRGSSEKPKFIVLEYRKGPKKEAPIVLVGKGVTFDTGGLNLKPSEGIYEMHMDMSGGASVIHALAAAARLKVKKNIIGLIPAVENMPSGSSYRPGDLLRTLSGKTIEVLNTDAEGRVILADALTYAERYKPKLVIDVATLTGAAEVALGNRASAIFSSNERAAQKLIEAGERIGDPLWPLPLWEEYEDDVRGTFGDLANMGKFGRAGGAISGAVFLWQFAKTYPWVHIDIAPRMTSIEGDYLAKGATGVGVPLLADFLFRAR